MKKSSSTITATGPLSPEEIEEIRLAYEGGCRGAVIMGLRGRERVVVMLVPTRAGQDLSSDSLAAKLRGLGCDRLVRIKSSQPD